jgi:serine/threonine protein kinase/Flp pilus assembly protein TadD
MTDQPLDSPDADDGLGAVLAACLEAVDRGEGDLQVFLARHPEFAAELKEYFAGQERVERVAAPLRPAVPAPQAPSTADPAAELRQLGDFRILREIGRGGMGVVYEAEQVSLSRRVALKVLPLAATLDERQLQRFKNEAVAAAQLDHPHIVDVLGVGSERGVHYYAMRLIQGRTVAHVIKDLRLTHSELPAAAALASRRNPEAATGGLQSPVAGQTSDYAPPVAEWPAPAAPATVPIAGPSTERSVKSREFFHSVARLAADVAEALDYAHQQGIIHRDIKPSNLMLDGRGKVWVTDFGLAHVQGGKSLTMTGDVVGTLRYMSPEQALAKRVVMDHRTDIYSLGATLYELLTLEPAYAGNDRQELLRQIAFDEPKPPRRINKAMPPEMETIVLKAMEKNPADRYATAQEMADDLRRFLLHEPIRARRPSLRQRVGKWARRHRGLVLAAAVWLVTALAVVGGAAGWVVRDRAGHRDEGERQAREALNEAERLQEEEKWYEALSAAKRAEAALANDLEGERARQARVLHADFEMALRLEKARLLRAGQRGDAFDSEAADHAYVTAFRLYDVNIDSDDPRWLGEQLSGRSIRLQLAAALDDWARFRRFRNVGNWKNLLLIARVADPDPIRNKLRDAYEEEDSKAAQELADRASLGEWPSATVSLLSTLLVRTGAGERAISVLFQARQRHPDDFWLNLQLGDLLQTLRPGRLDEAVRYDTTAVALRPHSAGAHNQLGTALYDKGQFDEATAEYRESIRLNPDGAMAHNNLGNALLARGQLDQAVAEYREALRLRPDDVIAHINLSSTLMEKGRMDEAIAQCREAIRLKPKSSRAHAALAFDLEETGQLDEAMAEARESVRLEPDNADGHNVLGVLLWRQGRLDESISECREAIRLKPHHPEAHLHLANALYGKGQYDEAVAEGRHAIRLKPHSATAHNTLGMALERKGRVDEAVGELREAIRLKPDYAGAQRNLRRAERFAALAARLPRLLQGKESPADSGERLALAFFCQQDKQLYTAAVRWYAQAFADEPRLLGDVSSNHTYNAACAAALAGCGQGKDAAVSEMERARLRRRALDWLRADLGTWQRVWKEEPEKGRAAIMQQLQHWLVDTDFGGVRGSEALAKLPQDERGDWQQLWHDVEALLQQAMGPSKTAPSNKAVAPRL